jgi:hypothetical protein
VLSDEAQAFQEGPLLRCEAVLPPGGGGDHHLQRVHPLQHEADQGRVGLQPVFTQIVEHVLENVGELRDPGEPDRSGVALDRVRHAEQDPDGFLVLRA